MNRREIEAAVSAAHGPSRETIEALPLDGGERELIEAIMVEAQAELADQAGARAASSGGAANSRRRLVGRSAIGLCGLGAVAVALAVGGFGVGAGSSAAPEQAFGAELVRLAEASPRVLLDSPGWHVLSAAEQSPLEGRLRFLRAGPAAPPAGDGEARQVGLPRSATLSWRPGHLTERQVERLAPVLVSSDSALRDRLVVFDVRGSGVRKEVTALWEDHGRQLSFHSAVPNLAAFKRLLSDLRRVGTISWLSALPPSAVRMAG